MEEGERPWLKNIVRSPASRDPEPGATRKRPLIFVYELPPLYNEALLQVCAQLEVMVQWMQNVNALSGLLQLFVDGCKLSSTLLQYRTNRADCVHRYFTGGNGSSFNDPFVYNSESGAITSRVSQSCRQGCDCLPICNLCVFPMQAFMKCCFRVSTAPWIRRRPITFICR